jgi:hypothetical protein
MQILGFNPKKSNWSLFRKERQYGEQPYWQFFSIKNHTEYAWARENPIAQWPRNIVFRARLRFKSIGSTRGGINMSLEDADEHLHFNTGTDGTNHIIDAVMSQRWTLENGVIAPRLYTFYNVSGNCNITEFVGDPETIVPIQQQ